jgi:hypothetical protein
MKLSLFTPAYFAGLRERSESRKKQDEGRIPKAQVDCSLTDTSASPQYDIYVGIIKLAHGFSE